MLPSQRLHIRLEELRQKLAPLAKLDEPNEEQRAEMERLLSDIDSVQTQYRAAVTTEAAEAEARAEASGEGAERRELRDRVGFGDYLTAAVELRAADGAAREFADSLGVRPGRFPLETLAPPEVRTTTDADAGPRRPAPWLDRVFADTAAMALGITVPSVDAGEQSYPVTATGAAAAQRGRGESIADSAWTVTTTELKPTRNGVRATYSREDDLRSPGLAGALQRELRMALAEGIDRAIFLGDSGANENSADITGLTTAAITEVTLTQSNKIKAANTLQAFTGLIDGKYARGLGDLRMVAAVGAAQLWEGTIANSDAENQTLAGFLRTAGLSWTVRGELEAATTADKFAAFIGLGRGIEGAAVAPVWAEGELIVDPYSGADSGEVSLTLSYFWAFGLPRPANFRRLKFAA